MHVLGDVSLLAVLTLKKTKHGWLLTSCFCLYNICRCTVLVPVCVLFACIYKDCAQFCLHAILNAVCLCLRCGTLTNVHTLLSANTPTPCLRLYALCSWHCLCFSLLVAPKLSLPDRQPQSGGKGRTRPAAPTAAWAPPRARNAAQPPTSASPVRYL